jgi:hypothetical protein
MKFIAYYIQGGRVTAVARYPLFDGVCVAAAVLTVGFSMQNDPVVSKASELLRLGLMPSVDAIKAGQVSQLVSITTSGNSYGNL